MERKWTRRICGCFKIFRTGRQVDKRASGNTNAGVEQRNPKKTDRQTVEWHRQDRMSSSRWCGVLYDSRIQEGWKRNSFVIQIFFFLLRIPRGKIRFSKSNLFNFFFVKLAADTFISFVCATYFKNSASFAGSIMSLGNQSLPPCLLDIFKAVSWSFTALRRAGVTRSVKCIWMFHCQRRKSGVQKWVLLQYDRVQSREKSEEEYVRFETQHGSVQTR